MQGSGTFAVEAMLTMLVPPGGKVLMLINGAYGPRAKKILEHRQARDRGARDAGRPPARSRRRRGSAPSDDAITQIFAVHCGTASGRLDPVIEMGALTRGFPFSFLLNSISAFGALPLDAQGDQHEERNRGLVQQVHRGHCCPASVSSSVARRRWKQTAGNATTLVLDLHDQWRNFGETRPTHSPRRST